MLAIALRTSILTAIQLSALLVAAAIVHFIYRFDKQIKGETNE